MDTLSAKLKISKKTVYKYFPTKQELAIAVYDYFYNDVNNRISGFISENIKDKVLFLLNIYFESSLMTHDEIFNKYALNDAVRSYAEGNPYKSVGKGLLRRRLVRRNGRVCQNNRRRRI